MAPHPNLTAAAPAKRHTFWYWAIAGVAAAGLALSACSDLVSPEKHALSRQFDTDYPCPFNSSYQCGPLSSAEAAAVSDALWALQSMWGSDCSAAGYGLGNYFNSGEILWTNAPVYGVTSPLQQNYSGIFLGSAAFNPGELANTLAHEYAHAEWGWHDPGEAGFVSSDNATSFGDACAGGI